MLEKIRIIPTILTRTLWFANISASSLGVNRAEAWKECNQRLFSYYRTHSAELPQSLKEMEPLFLAVICGCHAGLFREALHKIYIPRMQRGNASFAAKILGAQGALLCGV